MTVLQAYSHIAFTCMKSGLAEVRAVAREQLLRPGRVPPVLEIERSMNLEDIYSQAPPAGGRHPAKALFFAPRIAPHATVMFSNYADGWQTLAVCLSKLLPVPVYRFALCTTEAEWPIQLFEIWQGGTQRRHVSVIKDVDRWKFWQSGVPLPEESAKMYERRRIQEKLTSEYLASLAERLGFPVRDDRFWQSDSKAAYFEEH